ncbi:MAG: leucine-rich repeat domain-containing protein, partial [Treponema sp.]|nr:leucine-rich repeat domain-containing protein [Treponema sp.]
MKKNNKRQFSRKTAICFFGIILFLLLSGCSDPSMKDDPSKGTIILNLGGVPSTSRTAAMSDIQYEVTLYNEGISGDDGTPGGTFEAGASISIPVAPGTYRVGIRAYLKGAVYADGETGWNGSDPHVKITAGSSKGVKIVMEVYLSSYLNDPAFASAAEIDLPLAFTNLDSAKWGEILSAIDGQSKPVNLDLSACKVPGGTVDPGTGNAGGKAKIKSLILPAAATAIADGTSSAATFAGFNGLTTVKMGSGIVTIGDYAFSGLPITSVDLSGVEKIETHAFENCSSLASIV